MSSFPPEYLRAHLLSVGCDLSRVEESFTHSGGAGGQNVNKVATCVLLRYPPKQLLLKMQEHRTQASNRLAAWKLLARRLEELRARQVAERKSAREKARRTHAPRPHWLKARLRDLKRVRARKKSSRGSVEAAE